MALDYRGFAERKAALSKLLFRSRDGIQYVEHAEGHGDRMFVAACDLGLEGIISKKLNAPYRSGPSKNWLKIKNPQSAGSNPRAGWKFLVELLRWSNGYLCEVEVSNVIQVSFLWARRARERQLGLNGAKYAELRS